MCLFACCLVTFMQLHTCWEPYIHLNSEIYEKMYLRTAGNLILTAEFHTVDFIKKERKKIKNQKEIWVHLDRWCPVRGKCIHCSSPKTRFSNMNHTQSPAAICCKSVKLAVLCSFVIQLEACSLKPGVRQRKAVDDSEKIRQMFLWRRPHSQLLCSSNKRTSLQISTGNKQAGKSCCNRENLPNANVFTFVLKRDTIEFLEVWWFDISKQKHKGSRNRCMKGQCERMTRPKKSVFFVLLCCLPCCS